MRTGRPAEQTAEGLVEPAHAAEPRGERDLRHGHARLVDELLREQHAAGLRDRDGGRAQVLLEQPAELATADAQPVGQRVDPRLAAVQAAVGDERQRARDGVRGAPPGREVGRRLRAAAQARTEPRLLRGRGRREEAAVLELGAAGGTDRPAVDAGRGDADVDAAVVALVPRLEDPPAGYAIQQVHVFQGLTFGHGTLAVFGRDGISRQASARFTYSNESRTPSVGSCSSISYSMFAAYL